MSEVGSSFFYGLLLRATEAAIHDPAGWLGTSEFYV